MEPNQSIKYEIDFRKWLAYSESAKNPQMMKSLKKAIVNKKSYTDVLVEKRKSNSGFDYYFIESTNPIGLKIKSDDYTQLLSYFQQHYDRGSLKDDALVKEKKDLNKNDLHSDSNIHSYNKSQTEPTIGGGLSFLRKVSSSNKLRHSFNFSLLGLLALQIVIIPENISGPSLGNSVPYLAFGIMLLTWSLNFWIYTKYFGLNNSYREIFRLTANYFSTLWLFAFLELIIIDSIKGDISFLASIVLLVIGQISGLFISLFTSMIAYFIRGGKMINAD